MREAEPGAGGYRLIALIVAVLSLLALLPAVMMAGLSVMAFDAPGSTDRLEPWLWFGLFALGPVVALVTAILGFVCAVRPSRRLFMWTFAPALGWVGLFMFLALTMSFG